MGIRVIPDQVVPVAVARYLLPRERRVITVRQHPAVLIPAASRAAGVLLAAVAVTPFASSRAADKVAVTLIIWLVAAAVVTRFALAIYSWFNGYVVLTELRLIFTLAGLGSGAEQIPMERAKNLELRRTFGGRLLGYGSFIFDFDGHPQQVVDYLPYPEQLYIEVSGLVFPDTEAAD
jgi:TctA family transporter